MPAAQCRQRRHRGSISRRIITDVAVGHPQHPFLVVGLGAWRDLVAVGQQVVDGLQPGGADIASPGYLIGAGLRAKTSSRLWAVCPARSKRMSIRSADLLCQLRIAHPRHVPPLGHGGLQTMRQIVLDDAVGVSDLVMLLLVEVLKDTDQEIADGMPPQIGRYEAQAEPGRTNRGPLLRQERVGARG